MNILPRSVLMLALLSGAVILPLPGVPARGAPAGNSAPSELFSPDKKYSVAITHKALPAANPDDGPFTLTLLANGKVISQFPAEGWLLSAHWSADGKYVAVNNRRKNSADTLWVLSLADGRAIPVADDRQMVRRINDLFPDYTYDSLKYRTTMAIGWTKAGLLRTTTYMTFSNLHGSYIELEEINSFSNGKLLPIAIPIIKKVPSSGK